MKKFLSITLLVTLVLAAFFVINNKETQEELTSEVISNKIPKANRIQEAIEWRMSLLVDPETGEFNKEDLYRAVAKADEVKAQAAKSGALSLQWDLIGPDNQGGRTRALIFDRLIADKLWAGSVGGGLFKSLDGGNTWTRVETYDGFFPIGSIAQASDGALYVGSGEGLGNTPIGNGFSSQSPGNGIYKSTDDGLTWTLLPGTEASNTSNVTSGTCEWCAVNDIAISPINDNLIIAATQTGLRVSTMAGEEVGQWIDVPGIFGEGQAIEITSDGQTAFAAAGGRVYRSIDVANNFASGWVQMPITGGQRADVAIAPSNENYVYASVTASNQCMNGLWRSTDAGDTWTEIEEGGSPYLLDPFNQPTTDFGSCEGQGWYDQTIAVNPADEKKIYIGGITLYTWGEGVGLKRADVIDTEGGDPFNSRYIHADKHEIIFNPQDPTGNTMLVGSDGGVTLCNNALSGFPDNLNFIQKNKGYATLQVYGMGAGAYGESFAGTQDNGSQYINGIGSSPQAAFEVTGGDGVYAEISNLDPDVLFSGVYFGDLRRSVNRGLSANSFLDGNIDRGGCSKISCSDAQTACNSNYAPFIYPFYLMETSNVANPDDIAYLYAKNDTLLLASGATQLVIETLFPTYQITETKTYLGGDSTITVDTTYKSEYSFVSHVSSAVTFEQAIANPVFPGDTLWVADPYDAKYFVPSTCGLWMCSNPLQKNEEPVFHRISNFSNAQAFDASYDGDHLFFSVSNRVYRISGINSIHQVLDPEGCFNNSCAPGYTAVLIATVPGFGNIQGIAVDKNDANKVLVTSAGFTVNNSRVYRIEDALTGAPTLVNLHAAGSDLPRMPIYDCIIDFDNPDYYIVGSELGIWTSNDAGQTWTEDNDGMFGRMPVYRLRQEWMYEEDCMVLYAGTHGGGMFRTTSLMAGGCDPEPYKWPGDEVSIKEVPQSILNVSLYPNPVNLIANIKFNVEERTTVDLMIVDVTGRVVFNEQHSNLAVGEQVITVNAAELAKGNYFAVLNVKGKPIASKLFIKK